MDRARLRQLHPELEPWAVWLYEVAEANRLGPRIASTFRSIRQQRNLYERWTRLRRQGYSSREIGQRFGLWTPAPPGRSTHNYGVAFDMSAANLEALGELWRSVGGYWAGPSDPVHFAAVRSVDELF